MNTLRKTMVKLVCGYRAPGLWWFRILGRGIKWKDVRRHRLIFSERQMAGPWWARVRIGPWVFVYLRKDWR